MIVNITRTMKCHKYEYIMNEFRDIYAQSPYNYNILLKNITVREQNVFYTIRQTNWVLKIIALILLFWILPIDFFPKYKLFKNGVLIGTSKVSFFSPGRKLFIQNSIYEFYLHNDNYVSIMKDNVQIALVKKLELSIVGENHYIIDFEDSIGIDNALILLFVAFIDVIFFPNRFSVDAIRYEKTIGIDKYKQRVFWKSGEKEK